MAKQKKRYKGRRNSTVIKDYIVADDIKAYQGTPEDSLPTQ